MISLTTISHMQGISEAAALGELQLGIARLTGSSARVAVVAEVKPIEKGLTAVTPLAMLKATEEPFMSDDGTLTDEARRVFKALQSKLGKADHETWFKAGSDGHVQVSFVKTGAPANQQNALLILPWEDPHELFEHTVVGE
jgi:hypothetical protein